ncbi:hypothetical protein [Rhodoglobus aureus]|uniref:Uncharacterized protein n=1 Tax=Rhodoglobus aureus TaxID=191497 RepID=A0ABN1VPP4_9MICO
MMENRKIVPPATVVIVAIAAGIVVAALYAVILVLRGTSSDAMLAINFKYGLLFAIPVGVLVSLVAVSVGFSVRALLHTHRLHRAWLVACVAGLSVAISLIGSLVLLAAVLGVADFQWWTIAPCMFGSIGFAAWSIARDRIQDMR